MSYDMAADWIGAPKDKVQPMPEDRREREQSIPTAFDAIPEPTALSRCSRCGKPGRYRFTMYIKPDGRKGAALVSRTYPICEPCGSFIVFNVQQVFEK